jgi:hypothetical protein
MNDSILARCAGLIGITFIVLALAGCGGTKKPASAAATTTPEAKVSSAPLRSVTYRVTLSGPNPHAPVSLSPESRKQSPSSPPVYIQKPGGPRGSGTALVSIRAASNELCWEFEHLKNMILPPNEAVIAGKAFGMGITSTPLSDEHNLYVDAGCASEPRWLEEYIEQQPHSFEVVLRNGRYPERPLQGRIQP